MDGDASTTRAFVAAAGTGTGLQLAMVIAGHYSVAIQNLFAVLGMTLSLVAGALFALWARTPRRASAAWGGAAAGGVCALLGIVVSYLLGDVPAVILLFGTVSSTATGLLGGLAGWAYARRARPAL